MIYIRYLKCMLEKVTCTRPFGIGTIRSRGSGFFNAIVTLTELKAHNSAIYGYYQMRKSTILSTSRHSNYSLFFGHLVTFNAD